MTAKNQALRPLLEQGLEQLGISRVEHAIEPLLNYIALLEKWNRSYNLTAIRDQRAMITRHLLDSLAVIPYIKGPLLADIGTGAGLPGLPLAIVRPELNWLLVDSNGKKTRFVIQAVAELGLKNVRVVTGRIADLQQMPCANTVISRAFSDLYQFIEGAGPLCCHGGQLLAMKGMVQAAELQRLPDGYHAENISLQVPGLAEHRCIIKIIHNGNTRQMENNG